MTDMLFRTFACGQRAYFLEGEQVPVDCPNEDCDCASGGIYIER